MGNPKKPEENKNMQLIKNTCSSCNHWDRFPDKQQTAGEDIIGKCCLYPPKILDIEEDGVIVQSRPIMEYRDWCGQYQPRMH